MIIMIYRADLALQSSQQTWDTAQIRASGEWVEEMPATPRTCTDSGSRVPMAEEPLVLVWGGGFASGDVKLAEQTFNSLGVGRGGSGFGFSNFTQIIDMLRRIRVNSSRNELRLQVF